MNEQEVQEGIKRYQTRLSKFGVSKETLGWNKGKQRLRYHSFLKYMPLERGSVLEIGCGFGDGIGYLCEGIELSHYVGIDIVPEFIKVAKDRYPDLEFFEGPYLEYEPPKRFDYIVASGVFNYKSNQRLQNLRSLLDYASSCSDTLILDMLSDNVDWESGSNSYYSPSEIIDLVNTFTRRFVIDHEIQPFEFLVKVDFRDKVDSKSSLYLS